MSEPRVDISGLIYHVYNRAVGRAGIFAAVNDYRVLHHSISSALHADPVTLHAYALMPNHWHLLVETHADGALSKFVHRLSSIQARLWHELNQTRGGGHLYQGPFKSSLISNDAHFLNTARYIERNPLVASLVKRAEDWRWTSLCDRIHQTPFAGQLGSWPVDRPRNWLQLVNSTLPSDALKSAPPSTGSTWFRNEVELRLRALNQAKPG